ncbi:alpha/beta-hydrolase [Thozetella sp. PMI_491]|nr:alpha/beta-hydrolase [Thozetella sp. PMI_491]
MEYQYFSANDGCRLAFQTSLPGGTSQGARGRCILLMHGFSGSSEYFRHNAAALAGRHWVVAPDMRGHGKSDHPPGGYHVARLAADLRELIVHLRTAAGSSIKFVPVGCSIGAAVLWTYVELFGDADFAGLVFVDQAPLQNRSPRGSWDETKAHYGCYDAQTTAGAQRAWTQDTANAHRGLVQECLGYYQGKPGDAPSEERKAEDMAFFTRISAECDPEWLALLIADHTAYDHREAIELIRAPTLVMMGRYSGCFSLDGMRETVRRANQGKNAEVAKESVFECGHWLFYEDPERFNGEILAFVDQAEE